MSWQIAIVVGAVLVIGGLLVGGIVGARLPYGMPGNVVVRCRRGHLYTSLWVPAASIKAVRIGGFRRFQRCPVGLHWSVVRPVDPAQLSPAEIAAARARHDIPVP